MSSEKYLMQSYREINGIYHKKRTNIISAFIVFQNMERFSELYDNHWTDAMEALDEHNFDEKESIDMLVEIVEVMVFI
jgi:hypothetical protein